MTSPRCPYCCIAIRHGAHPPIGCQMPLTAGEQAMTEDVRRRGFAACLADEIARNARKESE